MRAQRQNKSARAYRRSIGYCSPDTQEKEILDKMESNSEAQRRASETPTQETETPERLIAAYQVRAWIYPEPLKSAMLARAKELREWSAARESQ